MRGKPLDPNSNTGKARAYYDANPGAEMTPQQMGKALNLTKVQVYTVIRNLTKHGYFESVRVIRRKA